MKRVIHDRLEFELSYARLALGLLEEEPFDRGEVHAQNTSSKPEMVTREMLNVSVTIQVPEAQGDWIDLVRPNLPWAEDHFRERVSGNPLNPPPSNEWWPYAQNNNSDHRDRTGKFSHTYPERFWPRRAEMPPFPYTDEQGNRVRRGIRFEYGDLGDLVSLLRKNPRSRQAYLPVWFPEDLSASVQGQRVPCTLGYHFLLTPGGTLQCSYFMRSCDLVRFYRDDVYMAGRLLQWVSEKVDMSPGQLILHTANLHAFVGDEQFLHKVVNSVQQISVAPLLPPGRTA